MLTAQMAAAANELESLTAQIRESESNLRVLEVIGTADIVGLRSKLAEAKDKRAKILAAIEAEAARTD